MTPPDPEHLPGASGRSGSARGIEQLEAELSALRRAVRDLAAARSLEETVPHLVEIWEGGGLSWDLACLLVVDEEAEVLRTVRGWGSGDADRSAFLEATYRQRFRRGQGIPGIVWQADQPVWLPDVRADPRYLRRVEASAAGLRTGVFLPARAGGRVVGVLELYSEDEREPDSAVLERLVPIDDVLGQLIERARAESESRSRSQQVRAIVDAALDAVVVADDHGVITAWNGQAEATFGWAASEAIGRPIADVLVPGELRSAHRTGMERYLQSRQPRVLGQRLEMPGIHRDGRRLLVELSIVAHEVAGRTTFSAFLRDVTTVRAAQELERSLARLPGEVPSPVLRVRPDGHVLYANPPAASLVRDGRVHHAELRAAVAHAFAQDAAESIELDADDASYALTVTPVPDEGYASVYGLDVTERRRVEHELRRDESDMRALYRIASQVNLDLPARIHRLLALMPDRFGSGSAIFGRIVPEGLEITDVSPADHSVVLGIAHPLEETISAEVIRRGDVVAINDLSRSGWSDHPAHRTLGLTSFIGAPIGSRGRIVGILSYTSREARPEPFRPADVDFMRLMAGWIGGEMERDRIAQDLADANRDLQEAAARARELALAADDASRAKGEFLAAMSHEIRTPLHGIIGSVDVLRGGSLDARARAIVDVLETSAGDLIRIVDDLLDFSRIESRQLELEQHPVSVRRLLDEAVRLYAPGAEIKGVLLEAHVSDDVPPRVVADPTRLRQVIGNLVANAVKFTSHGQVVVRAMAAGGEGSATAAPARLRLEVEDTGIGMDEETISRAFDPFFQADASTSRRYGGTGLGLAITRRLVELMGGGIEVRSRPDHGTSVTVDLPLRAASGLAGTIESDTPATIRGAGVWGAAGSPVSPGEAEPHATFAASAGRVLVVDDDRTSALVARVLLERHGVSVEVAVTGTEALERLAVSRPDLVLLDRRLPGMDGFEVARRQRQQETRSGQTPVPLIAATADVHEDTRDACLAAGMSDHLPKPFREADLVAMLRRWLPPAAWTDAASSTVAALDLVGVAPAPMPTLPPGVLADALDAGGPEGVLELIHLFQQSLTEAGSGIRQAMDAGRLGDVAEISHRLRGGAASIGEPGLAELLADIESTAAGAPPGSEPSPSLQALAARLDREVGTVMDRLDELCSGIHTWQRRSEP